MDYIAETLEEMLIHEFADSQLGHIFAKGATWEDARKALQLALQNVHVCRDIWTPVEYLVELAETRISGIKELLVCASALRQRDHYIS